MGKDPLTPYGNRPMVTPIVNAVNYEYLSFEVLRQITDGEIDGYTYHRDDNPTVRQVERRIAALERRGLRDVPGALVAQIDLPSDVTSITTDQAPLSGWTASVDLADGRRYLVVTVAHVAAVSGGGGFSVNTMDGGTRIQLGRGTVHGTNIETVVTAVVIAGDGASHTIRGDFDVRTAGTYEVYTGATNPTAIYVLDAGAS